LAGKLKKTIFLSILVIVLAGAGIAFYLYNKGAINVNNASPEEKIAAVDLYRSFTTDSISAQKKFGGKDEVIEVSGMVKSVSQNQQNQAIILLNTSQSGAYVNCTLEGSANSVKEGDVIKIKGLCSGIGEGDKEMGLPGDVYLIRCYLVN
jgi:flagellar basal body-associated protein FliL